MIKYQLCNCFFLLLLWSCDTPRPERREIVPPVNLQHLHRVKHHSAVAVILTDALDLYDRNFSIAGRSKDTVGLIVEIDSISEQRIALSDSTDDCNLHHFIRVKSQQLTGWIYGEYVFEQDLSRDTTFNIAGVELKLIPTENFGVGCEDDEGPTFCCDPNPLLLYNSDIISSNIYQ